MIRKSLIALAALTLVGAAHAGTYAVTGSFDINSSVNVLTGTFSFDDGAPDVLTALDLSFTPVTGTTFTLNLGQAIDAYVELDGTTVVGPNGGFNLSNGGQLQLQSFFGSSNFTYSLAGSTDQLGTLTVTLAGAVPEPSSYALLLGGLGAMGLVARRRKA